MPLVDFGKVSNELGKASQMTVMRALVRSSLTHGADNIPAVLIVTDKALYYGGTQSTGRKFHRISMKSILDSRRAGRYLWECVQVRHMGLGGEESVYLCPFKGPLSSPKKDYGLIKDLIKLTSR